MLSTILTSPRRIAGVRRTCQRLVALEQRLSGQRKLIAALKERGLETAAEQQQLAHLLAELDILLGKTGIVSADIAPR